MDLEIYYKIAYDLLCDPYIIVRNNEAKKRCEQLKRVYDMMNRDLKIYKDRVQQVMKES